MRGTWWACVLVSDLDLDLDPITHAHELRRSGKRFRVWIAMRSSIPLRHWRRRSSSVASQATPRASCHCWPLLSPFSSHQTPPLLREPWRHCLRPPLVRPNSSQNRTPMELTHSSACSMPRLLHCFLCLQPNATLWGKPWWFHLCLRSPCMRRACRPFWC